MSDSTGNNIFLIDRQEKKWIGSGLTFKDLRFSGNQVEKVSNEEIGKYGDGEMIYTRGNVGGH